MPAEKNDIMINYVSFAGLQNHLAYDSFDCGRAGTGYVNLYNGDVVIARPLTQCGGNRMPVSITAYYGAQLSGVTARVGSHWRLSCDQCMNKSYINDELYFIWSKGDGDQQYFKKPNSSAAYYEDLSGLSLKLTDNGTYTEIEDKGGTVMRFESPQDALDDTGRLLSITDSCGNTNTFQYGDWRLERITDGAGRVTQFTYSGNVLTGILAPGETAPVTLEYYNNMRLNGIVDADGERTSISWTQVAGEFGSDDYVESIGNSGDGRYLEFTYPYAMPHRVERMRIVYPTGEDLYVGNSHAYSYRDMMTVVQDMTVVNGKRMIYQFNDFGNVVSVRDELGYASYSKFSEALLPNHPEQVSKLQRSVVNLLPNHDFELSGYWSNVCYYNGQATFTYDTTEKYMGTRSMKVNKTNSEGNACLFMNFNKLEVGKTYTLSAYMKSTLDVNCYATVSQGAWYDGEKVTSYNKWTRIFTTFTATQVDATLYFITMGGPGTIWIDCAQLEEGTVPNRYNLIRNSDFSQNDSGVPTFWTANGVNTSEDAIVTDADALHPTFLTNNRMRLYGDPQTNKGIYQDLPLSGSQGDVYVAGGWAKGFSRPIGDDKRHFGIRVAFKNSSGAYENGEILNWNEEWTDWQYVSGAVIAPCAYTGIRFNVDYEKNVNYADFDGMTLYKEEFGNTFTYDDDGNVTAVKDLVGQKAKAQYDAQGKPGMVTYNDVDYFYVYNLQGDVVALIDANGTQVVEYGYDAWGYPISKTGSLAATIGTLNPFRYRGYVYDEETGLYYLRSRYYNPSWKRFINADKIQVSARSLFQQTLFIYCLNNPLIFMDSTGCFANLIDSLKTKAYRINVLIEVAIHSEKMRGNKNVTQVKRVFERLQSKTRRKYTYGNGKDQFDCATLISSSLPKGASQTGMTAMFNSNSLVRGTIEELGGKDALIPGMVIGQSGVDENGKTCIAHGGVYAGKIALVDGGEPVHAVYQSVSPGTKLKGNEGGPLLTEMSDDWDVWMWHTGMILDY